ncbi:hypothetical protein L6452_15927 [Arctium lappa]|uniref:Uncharacterized protein n=1 Tax=Arctium lappa TaxID=4217 RepID=A0ACB9CPW5_ARCLA|nr:hypothetical protein L6452_15927 [Arctium lappa]
MMVVFQPQEAKDERFFLKIDSTPLSSQLRHDILYQQRRVFTNEDISNDYTRFPTRTTRSLLCFHADISSFEVIARSFVLLRVLDLQQCRLHDIPQGLALLVHLRNLVNVAKRDVIGDVKACKVHDLVRELCLQKAKEERFFLKIDSPPLSSQLCEVIIGVSITSPLKWDACEQQFRQLKLLTFENLYIKHWEASSTSFPCLKRLALWHCQDLEEIPLEIGEIATLELIEIHNLSNKVVESVKRIQQEQHDVGNDELNITISGMDLSFYLSQYEGSESE